MKASHTPGPWSFEAEPGHGIWVGNDEYNVAEILCNQSSIDDFTALANARLISQAPALAEILDRILRAHESANNGAVSGEAKLCVQFVELARGALKEAGLRS